MKPIKLFIFLFFFSSILIAQQSAVVTYKVFKIPEHSLAQKIKEKHGKDYYENSLKRSLKIYSIAKDFDFVLKFNPNESRYEWKEEMRDETTNAYMWILAKLMGGGMSVKYQNRKDSLLMSQFTSPINHKMYRETGSLYSKQWKITKETDAILGYPVVKAVSGNINAWFAPAIPVPFGPKGVGGLPGLILKISNNSQFPAYALEATEIRFYKKPLKITKPKKGILRTKEEGRKQRIKNLNKL